MKKSVIIFMILLLSLISGCANSYDNSSNISDPFSDSFSESKEDRNPTRDELTLIGAGGYRCEVNGGEPVEYNGEPITLPVKATASDDCKADMSIGIMCCINGNLQRLSSENDKDKVMIIKTGIAPGNTLEFEITFTPEILPEDADKKQLPITFFSSFNPTYKASEEYVAFGYTHDIGWVPSKYIEFNSKPNIFSPNKYNLYEEKIALDDEKTKEWYLQDEDDLPVSTLKINENNTVEFTALLENCKPGEYVGYVLKNNEITKINDGQDCVGITIKASHSYNIDIKIEDVKKGDVINCFFAKKESNEPFDLIQLRPKLAVNSDFKLETDNGSNSEVPAETDLAAAPSITEDNQIPQITGAPDNISVVLPDNSYTLCQHLGYMEGDPRLAVCIGDGLLVYDAENGKLLNSLEITDHEETDDGYIQTDWHQLQVLKDQICVPKLIVKNNEVVLQGVSLYDKNLNFVKDIAVIASAFTYDGKNKINIVYDNYSESMAQTVYISDIEDSNIRGRKLCEIPEKYNVIKEICVADDDFMYGLLKEADDEKEEAYAFAVDLKTGELIINAKKLEYSLNGRSIFSAGKYALYATGINDRESTNGGTLVYFDKQNRKFKEIQALSSTECSLAAITPDGKKIVTCASVFQGKDKPHYQSVRVYSTSDGTLIGSLEGSFNSAPLCTDKGFIIYGAGAAKKISFAEMGLN